VAEIYNASPKIRGRGGLKNKHPILSYSSSESNKSVTKNRQCGGEKLKYAPTFYIGDKGHVISRMRNDDLLWSVTLQPNISKTAGDTHLVTMEDE